MRVVEVPSDHWVELSTCPVCSRSDRLLDLVVVEASMVGPVLSGCLDCSHLFKRRRPTAEWLDEYYASDWDEEGRRSPKQVRARTGVLDFCKQHLPDAATVLDMGAGFGRDAVAFREAGHQVLALEASQHRARFIDEVLGIPCLTSSFETAEVPDSLDLIFSNHVLEHVTEPRVILERAEAVLPEAGLLYVAMPNCLSYENALQLVHYAPHQSGFGLGSFTRLLDLHGFQVVKAEATQELRVLARRTSPSSRAGPNERRHPQLSRRTIEEWVATAFGRRSGKRTLVWWRPSDRPMHCYDGTVLPGGTALYRVLQVARNTYFRLPKRMRRRGAPLPPFIMKKQVRMMPVSISGGFELPVRIRYNTEEPPIWVK